MKTMQKIFTSLFLMFSVVLLQAQSSAQIKTTNDLTPGYWILGLNTGLSYQSSDIKAQLNGFGFGATLGKNLYYQPGAPLAFDLRGRLLFARNYGLDFERSFAIENNSALNGTSGPNYLNYPSELEEPNGFVFQNHQTDIGELALEGVLTLNSLRENTGLVASLYGGIGLDWYRAKVDQLGANGQPYYQEYSTINTNDSKSSIRNELKTAILDGNYETLADDFDTGGKLGFMPSLGVEIGYEFTPVFSMHLGHRTTFSGTNLLDGHQWADDQNDLYHYTNLALRWKLFGRTQRNIARPQIEILQPFGNNITSTTGRENIRARVTGVNGPTDIVCRINGRPVPFDYRDGILTVTPPLNTGQNTFEITAKNTAGSDQESLRIFLEGGVDLPPPPPPTANRPNVALTNPPRNSYSSTTQNFEVKATITGIRNKSNIQFYLNGREERNFRFYGSNGQFQVAIRLNSGANDIELRASNQAGRDVAKATIYYEQTQNRPTVYITDPRGNSVETDYSTTTIRAEIKNINNSSDITFTVNGRANRNFSYNAGREAFEAEVNLLQGRNMVEITASNTAGTASDRVEINYRQAQPKRPPVVRITTPERNNTSTRERTARIEAQIDHVSSKNDIQFYLNGRREYSFNYSSYNGRLSKTVDLREGENEIRIKATNPDGQDEARVTIRRLGDIQMTLPPTVRITQPRDNDETSQSTVSLRAEVKHINNKSDISLTLNGRRITSFSFNSNTDLLTASLNLSAGNNTIIIAVSNSAGQDSDQVQIRYEVAKPPSVQINSPTNNSSSDQATITLSATTKEVSGKENIILTVNNKRVTNFQFNSNTGQITATIRLSTGTNRIEVEVENEDGRDEDRITVNYRQPTPPSIVWQSPKPNSEVNTNKINIRAQIEHVPSKSDIQLLFNGNKVGRFSYTNGSLTATLSPLKKGANQIEVIAQNQDGRDREQIKISYVPEVTQPKPVVKFLKPSKPGTTVTDKALKITASVENIKERDDITLLVNGKVQKAFAYSSKSKQLEADLTLQNGKNKVEIRAKNAVGSSEATTDITYRVSRVRLPEITFESVSQPTINPLNPQVARSTVIATIKNVTGKDQITFLVNGEKVTDFNFDVKTMRFQSTINLAQGVNVLIIKAENRSGTDEKSYEITF